MHESTTIALGSAALLGFPTAQFELIFPAYTADPAACQLVVEIGALEARTTVSLNNGSRSVAYQGAKTAGNQSSQLITQGSATVLVP